MPSLAAFYDKLQLLVRGTVPGKQNEMFVYCFDMTKLSMYQLDFSDLSLILANAVTLLKRKLQKAQVITSEVHKRGGFKAKSKAVRIKLLISPWCDMNSYWRTAS